MTDDALSYIAADLRDKAVPVDDLYCDPANVREHPDRNRRAVRESLEGFGQRQVLVADEDGRVIAGNLRLKVMRDDLGWDAVAAIQVDDDEIEAARYAIADNRSGELAVWDEDALGDLLEVLDADFDGIGFTDQELDAFVDDFDVPEPDENENELDDESGLGPDDTPTVVIEVRCPPHLEPDVRDELDTLVDTFDKVEVD